MKYPAQNRTVFKESNMHTFFLNCKIHRKWSECCLWVIGFCFTFISFEALALFFQFFP